MRFNFPSHAFIFILLLSPITLVGNFQNVYSQSTGQWTLTMESGWKNISQYGSEERKNGANISITTFADGTFTGTGTGWVEIVENGGICDEYGRTDVTISFSGYLGYMERLAGMSFNITPEEFVVNEINCDDPQSYSASTVVIENGFRVLDIELKDGAVYGSGADTYASQSSGISAYERLEVHGSYTSGSTSGESPGGTESQQNYGGYSSWDEYCKANYGNDYSYDAENNACIIISGQDSDNDTIDDSVDQCIGLLEDYYGENDEDGCPEKDSDDDTLYDYEDSCPNDPEDFLGIEDGCPEEEEDSDGDSFYDNEDVCPYDAEDHFEFGKLEGCPEEDSDGDNIYDSIDQCIDEPEDTVGDTDGCPNQDEFVEDEFAEEESLTETPPKFTEPPSPLVLPVTEEKKPFLKALWDGKCDTLSHQWQLLTDQSGQLPIVCTDGKITLSSGDQLEFSIADDWDVKLKDLYMEKAQEILVTTLAADMPPVAALLEMFEPFEKAHGKIGNIKALHLTLKTGETELLGGLIQIKTKCILPECKFIKLEEEGGGFKFYSLPTFFDKDTNEVVTELAHGSVYILIEYTPIEKVTTTAKDGGCLIATATYGSELAPQVQFLREIRDNTVLSTASGTSFMTAFNSFYYSFSPAVADLERQNPVFKEVVKIAITPLLSSLSLLQHVGIDSEAEMLGYGIGVILLNIGMYFVAPTLIVFKLKNRKKEKLY